MSRFYMMMNGGKSNSETVTRRCYTGASATVASYKGAVEVTPYSRDGVDCVRVVRRSWQGSGGPTVVIYDGPFEYDSVANPVGVTHSTLGVWR